MKRREDVAIVKSKDKVNRKPKTRGRPRKELGRICPSCNGMDVVRMGKQKTKDSIETQRFICKNKECRRSFH